MSAAPCRVKFHPKKLFPMTSQSVLTIWRIRRRMTSPALLEHPEKMHSWPPITHVIT